MINLAEIVITSGVNYISLSFCGSNLKIVMAINY